MTDTEMDFSRSASDAHDSEASDGDLDAFDLFQRAHRSREQAAGVRSGSGAGAGAGQGGQGTGLAGGSVGRQPRRAAASPLEDGSRSDDWLMPC
jgi:hypothetical protein